jgi:hypothetical protein
LQFTIPAYEKIDKLDWIKLNSSWTKTQVRISGTNIYKEWKKRNHMTIEEVIKMLEETTDGLKTTLRQKSSDYTGGETSQDPFANFKATEVLGVDSVIGVMIRLMDKIQRVRSFANDGELKVKDESVDDAFNDIIGYTILAKAMTREKRQKAQDRTQ